MARKEGKNIAKSHAAVEQRPYQLKEAVDLLQKVKFAKFDETIELVLRLGVDPRHADQMVRGTIVLPHGLGKSKKVLVIASGEEMVKKISEGWADYDAVISTPDMMKSVGRLGKVLGPRGLMPNPKAGTVTTDVKNAVKETKAGKVEFRTDKTAQVHTAVGKMSFAGDKLVDNAAALIGAVVKAKPSAAKGKYVKSITLSSSMGPGVPIDLAIAEAEAAS